MRAVSNSAAKLLRKNGFRQHILIFHLNFLINTQGGAAFAQSEKQCCQPLYADVLLNKNKAMLKNVLCFE